MKGKGKGREGDGGRKAEEMRGREGRGLPSLALTSASMLPP